MDLAATVLALHAWGKPDPRLFGWYEPPTESALAAAERLLAMLGALTGETNGRITPLGRRLMAFPAHPRLARLMAAAVDQGLMNEGAALAALLSEKDIVAPPAPGGGPRRPAVRGSSDLLIRLDKLAEAERRRFAPSLRDDGIDPAAARQAAAVRDDLLRLARRAGGSPPSAPPDRAPPDETALLKLVLLAYPDRVARRRASDPLAAVMVGGGGVRLSPDSAVHAGEFFVAVDARQDERSPTREALVRVASGIQPEWLEELFPGSVTRSRSVAFDAGAGGWSGRA